MKTAERKKYKIIIAVVLLLFLVGAVACFCRTHQNNDLGNAVLEINSSPVYEEELLFYMEESRAEVVAHFQREYGLTFGEGFWQTEVDGTTPEEYLRALAVENLTLAKVVQLQAQQRGIIDDVSYDPWKAEFDAGGGSQQPYGISSFDFRQFYDYRQSQIALALEKAMTGVDFLATEADLRAFYDENKEYYRDSEDDEPVRYQSYETVKDAVISQYYHRCYIETVKEWAATAEVDYFHPYYEEVCLE